MLTLFKRLIVDELGASAVEYGLIAGLIAIVIIAAVSLLGDKLVEVFQGITRGLEDGLDKMNKN